MSKTTPPAKPLAASCESVETAATDARAWFAADKVMPTGQRADLERQMKLYAREARRLKRAAERPMCAAVFGASQVGKSFLTSSLASAPGEPMSVRLGERTLDFLTEINPEGNQDEATALVTRFTTRPPETPVDYPVHVRLLSQADLAKVLMNTYLLDFAIAVEKQQEPSPEEIAEALEVANRKARRTPPADALNEDDILDLKEYMHEKFNDRTLSVALRDAGFWEDLERIGPYLPAGETTDLLAFFWGRNPGLTELFQQLQDTLRQVANADTVNCEIDALLPREQSVINVGSLAQIGSPNDPRIGVQLPDGQTARVPRATLGALIAEIVMPLSTTPHSYFNHTDLLDFPGYRNRFGVGANDFAEYLENPAKKRELFLRGKVDYLFDAYRREQEITALLLCQAPGNQEAHSIPPLIEKWVEDTHGATPEERSRARTALFCVKTKFDTRFEGITGQDSAERWKKAIEEQHLSFLGRTAQWPETWTPGAPFRNIFWLRSPQFENKNVFTYDADGKESGFDKPELIEKQKKLYLDHPLIRKYVANPEEAWDAAFAFNDGGVTRLTQALDPVCNPDIKAEQVATRLAALTRKLIGRLDEHHVEQGDEELDKRREQAREALELILDLLGRDLFPAFLEAMQLSSDELARTLRRIAFDTQETGRPAKQAVHRGVDVDALRSELLGVPSSKPKAAQKPKTGGSRTREAAETAMERWRSDLGEAAERATRLLGPKSEVDPALANVIARELREAADRIDLTGRIANRLETFTTGYEKPEDFRDRLALVGSNMINDFVCDLDHRGQPPQGGGDTPLFPPPATSEIEVDLIRGELSHLQDYARDWCRALLSCVDANVTGGVGPEFDEARNEQLGGIIQTARRAGEGTA